MDEPRRDDTNPPGPDKPGATPPPSPDLAESLRDIGAAGRSGLKAASDAAKALRILVAADLSLARSAFGRALAFTGVAVAFGGSAWMLLMAALTAVLHDALDWSWTLSLAVCALLSIAVTAFGAWRAMHYFEHTRLQATRRQLARLGIGELADLMPDPDSPESTQDAAARVAAATDGAPMKKGLGVDVTPPGAD
ncbi:phage holin family protein [Lysobacter solisilvae (ex Woo and Kim 2020)]|uniref:phage holin family protein n=1 Tax=Agrilutibacter terrestris TaxID=2865112 RepID=UPI001CECCFDA|nr:phage holin family protein [Lysobacter terrestris]